MCYCKVDVWYAVCCYAKFMRCNIHTTAGCVYAFCCGKNGEGRRELAKNVVLVVWHGGLIRRDERRMLGVLEVRQWSEADDRGVRERLRKGVGGREEY